MALPPPGPSGSTSKVLPYGLLILLSNQRRQSLASA
jgi:hypothetical protein